MTRQKSTSFKPKRRQPQISFVPLSPMQAMHVTAPVSPLASANGVDHHNSDMVSDVVGEVISGAVEIAVDAAIQSLTES